MTEEKKKTLGEYFIQFQVLIYILIGILTAIFIYGVMQKLSINVVLEEMIPPNHPFIKLHKEYAEQYGGTSTFLMAVVVKDGDIYNPDTLAKIKRINDEILFYPDVRRAFVYSIAQRKSKVSKGHAGGTVDVSALMWPELDSSPEGIARIKSNISTSDLYNGTLVSKDGKAAMIMADCWPDLDYTKFFNFIHDLKEKEEDENTTLHVAGRPMLLGWIFHFMPTTYLIFTVTCVFMVLVLAYIFRNIVGLVIPIIAGILSTIWGFGFISLLGINFNPLMIVLAILVGARALSHSVQTTRRYLEELHVCGDKKKAAVATIDGLFLASLAAIVTDAAGFSVLILARIPMIQKIALLCSFWVIAILLIVSALGPLLCVFLPKPKNLQRYSFSWEKTGDQPMPSTTSSVFDIAARLCFKKSNIAIILALVITGIVAGYLATGLKIGDTNPGSPILWPDSVYNLDCKMINDKFEDSGTDMMMIIVEGDKDMAVEQPEVLKRVERYERFIQHKYPDVVAGCQSLTKILRTMHKEFREGDARYLTIPQDIQLIGNLMFFHHTAGDPSDTVVIYDPHFKHTVIRVFLKDHQGDTLRKVISATQEFFASQPPIEGIKFRSAAGYGGILAGTNEEIKWSEKGTLLLVFLTVFVFCGIAYRSVVAAILLCVPLLVANLVAFAYMALRNIGLDINSLPVSAVGIGVGVDYGIYMLSRMEEEFKNTRGNWEMMAHTSLNSAGKAVFITALTVIIPILLWPIMADLKFQAEMGLLLSFIMFFDMLGALLFLPAAVCFFKPKFIKRHTHLTDADLAAEAGFGPADEAGMSIADAIYRGNVRAVKDKIGAGVDINAAAENGTPLIVEAVKVTSSDQRNGIIKQLLNAKADINTCDVNNNSALYFAACYGFNDTVKLLIDKGAHIKNEAPLAETAMGTAIEHGNIKTVELLMENGARVTAETIKYAAEHGGHGQIGTKEILLKLFVHQGVDFSMKDEGGMPIIDYIKSLGGFENLIKHLERGER